MEFLKVGKLVNTHGIKGEVKILSDFSKKEKIFIPSFILYIGKDKCPMEIESYRHHKIFDMVVFKGITNINEVLEFKGMEVFINKTDLTLSPGDYLLEELIGLEVICNEKRLGTVNDLVYNNGNDLISVTGDKNFYIPLKGSFITKVDIEKKVIEVENIEGLII